MGMSSGIRSNSFIARFTLLNVPRGNAVIFRYRLAGANQSWTETTQRELQFAELAPGTYRLEVEAQDRSGIWSGERAEFAFRILTPWYSSWWFLSLCVFTPVTLTAGGVRLRMLHWKQLARKCRRGRKTHAQPTSLSPSISAPGSYSTRGSRKTFSLFSSAPGPILIIWNSN